MNIPIPVGSIPKADAIEAARKFIDFGDFMDKNDQWNAQGVASFYLSKGDFERIVKVLYVGIGELAK